MDKDRISEKLAQNNIVTVSPHVNRRWGYPKDIVVYCDIEHALDDSFGHRVASILGMKFISMELPTFNDGTTRSEVWINLRETYGET